MNWHKHILAKTKSKNKMHCTGSWDAKQKMSIIFKIDPSVSIRLDVGSFCVCDKTIWFLNSLDLNLKYFIMSNRKKKDIEDQIAIIVDSIFK